MRNTNRNTNRNNNNTEKVWAPRPEKPMIQNSKQYSTKVKATTLGVNNPTRGQRAKALGVESNPQIKRTFADALQDNIAMVYGGRLSSTTNLRQTENGAWGYASTNSALLDMNFQIVSYRNKTEKQITDDFRKAYAENPMLALRWLFWVGDIRGGSGERRLFRVILADLAKNGQENMVKALLPLLGEYRRYDDIYTLSKIPCMKNSIVQFIRAQWEKDCQGYLANKPISLFAKWCASENASSAETRKNGAFTRHALGLTPKEYRKTLSTLRKYIDVVERKMSSQNWQAIDYEAVPSKANLNYNNAFLKHDEQRRRAFLGALDKGEAKINSGVLYPYEIANRYRTSTSGWGSYRSLRNLDQALEGMWRSLPDYVKGEDSILVVADGSGSMEQTISKSTTASALCVANALAIYFSERLNGPFKDKFITFSAKPKFVDLSGLTTLRDKLVMAYHEADCSNTNIEATFDMILNTAVINRMSQEDMPKTVLVISDMQFDSVARSHQYWNGRRYVTQPGPNKVLFEELKQRFADAGYKMPKLVFWNVANRNTPVPVTVNEMGVVLLSGFAPATLKMALTGKTDPYEAMVDVLLNKRYDPVEEAVLKAVRA